MALSVNTPRAYETGHDDMENSVPLVDSVIVYDGAAVGQSGTTGTFRGLVSGDDFSGFAVEKADNTVVGHAASFVSARVKTRGRVQLAVTGATATTDVGKSVYATADDTFTLTPSGSKIGTVSRWVVSTTCIVEFNASMLRRQRIELSCPIKLHASATVMNLWVAPFACRVVGIKWVNNIAQAITGTVVKATSTTAPAAGTTPMHTANAITFTTTASTVSSITLGATVADQALVAGERIGLVLNSALTTGDSLICISIEPVDFTA
jgi:hypothetical protein